MEEGIFESGDDKVTAGIIGGFGGMGRLFTGIFQKAGFNVIASGRHSELTNKDLAVQSDIVIVSVPIHDTVRVIEEIAPLMTETQILCDFTSIKTKPLEAMMKSKAQVLGLHPMFGPSVSSIEGQTIAAFPLRIIDPDKKEIYSIFESEGARICEMTPEEHDKTMAIVQALVHFATLSVADTVRKTLESNGIPLDSVLSVMSPVYRMEMGLIGRILGQDSSLYGDIMELNPLAGPVLDEFTKSAGRLREIVASGNPDSFNEFFKANSDAFREYIPQAARETDLLIDTLAKVKSE